MQLQLGDRYRVPNAASGPDGFVVEIKQLGTTMVLFAVSGRGARNPEKLRDMPITAFAKWLLMTKAKRVPQGHGGTVNAN